MDISTIVVVGGNGKIARLLTEQTSLKVISIVRDPKQTLELEPLGAQVRVIDVENAGLVELVQAFRGAQAVVFAAGGGAGSGIFRKYTTDLGGSIRAQQAALRAGIDRFVQISFIGAANSTPEGTDPVFAAYWDAKRIADDSLRASGLTYTIVKPGVLTDENGTGNLTVSEPGQRTGRSTTARANVAAFILAILDDPRTYHRDLDIADGATNMLTSLSALVDK
ncbi:MAG: SDR family oxidoreductase [Kocuria sp.]|nr:SDR family oxidoreductase [Kocuria sp.]